MASYITVDGGTTNTRVALVIDNKVIETQKISIGSKDCITSNEPLKTQIKASIENLLKNNSLTSFDIYAVLASGMITCEYGLYEVKHLFAPVGINELNLGMQKKEIPEICDIPFFFIPGVRINSEIPAEADMMRGEETEIMGLVDEFGADCVYVLPGSHSKLIVLDDEKRILSFKTMMTGEMISALSKNTILNGTVDLSITEHDTPSLIMGYEYCIKYGINDALFKTRILKNLFSKSDIEIYSYFLGVVLANEIEALKKFNKNGVVIGGKSQLKNAMCDLLKATTDLEIICVPEDMVDNCVFMGQVKVFEHSLSI